MNDKRLTRRRVIRAAGVAAVGGLAGCSDGGDGGANNSTANDTTTTADSTATAETNGMATENAQQGLQGPRDGDDLPPDPKPDDGYPPEFETVPAEREVDPSSFPTLTRSGMEIRLVPTEVAYYWYARGEARFVDTRSESEFEVSHIFGSVLSPAGDGRDLPDDPALQWPTGDRVVTYCDCPHHLSSLRAASLMSRGYSEVYALDKGFSDWRERNYPLAGTDTDRVPTVYTIEGAVPRRHAGETAWAYHTGSDQREATVIRNDGSYALDLKFVDMTEQSEIRVETPAYEVVDSLGRLTNGRITAEGTVTATGGNATGTTATTGTQ